MNKAKIFSILTISLLFMSLAYADLVDGESFILYLKGSDHENINSITGFYDGYISGVADSAANSNWCPPEEFKRSQLLRIINEFYKQDTKHLEASIPAKELILHALQDAYPCN